MHISVFGIGYVGIVSSACLADAGHTVIAVDIDSTKVEYINAGRAPIIEESIPYLLAKGHKNKTLRATQDHHEAIMATDISIICVGTPGNPDGSLKLDYVENVCKQIGEVLRKKDKFHTVILRSTCLPNTSQYIAIPALEKSSGKKAGVDFGFGYNPEFLREGSAVYDYRHPPKIVAGANDEKTAKTILSLYDGIDAPRISTSLEIAEGVKYTDNAWHATKIGFANEIGNIMKAHDVDSHKVMEIFCMDTKLNISSAYLKPGFSFGGSCLPKDIRALCASAKSKCVNTPILNSVLHANEEQIQRAYQMVKDSGKKKIGMMGLAFKEGTDDLRESPLVKLAELLIRDGHELVIFDPSVYIVL